MQRMEQAQTGHQPKGVPMTATAGSRSRHSMTRRSAVHDYSRPGIYHITIHVAEGLRQPLCTVVGTDAASAAVALTPVGKAVERELLTAIATRYPMITVDTYVIMPDHLHFILIVRDPIISENGRSTHLGQAVAGFKTGCDRAYWAITGQQAPAAPQGTPAAKPPGTVGTVGTVEGTPAAPQGTPAAKPPGTVGSTTPTPATAGAPSVGGGFAAAKPRYSTGRQPLFAPGYCDVQPIEPGQLELQRAYIRNNPRSRWLRTHDRARLQTQRGGIDTALAPAALRGYLQRECPPSLIGPDALDAIERRLLQADGHIACDSYGDRTLLQRPLLPVVCHRKDAARLSEQKARCLTAAAQGAVLVSPRIAKGEQAIIDEAMRHGFPVALIHDNGFPERFHPSAERIALCSDSRLLMVTPWQYEYRGKDDQVTVPFCKTMNCVAQALCRKKDSWWTTTN